MLILGTLTYAIKIICNILFCLQILRNLKYIMNFKILKIIQMDYPNLNRTRKNSNRIRTEIQKYPNGTEIFEPENPKTRNPNRSEPNPNRYPNAHSQLILYTLKPYQMFSYLQDVDSGQGKVTKIPSFVVIEIGRWIMICRAEHFIR